MLAADAIIDLDKVFSVNRLTFNANHMYTLQRAPNTQGALKLLKNLGRAPEILVADTNLAPISISVPLEIGTDLTVDNASAVRLTIGAPISGQRGIDFVGTGLTYLKGTNTFAGLVLIADGNIAINADAALGKADNPIRLQGGGILRGLDGNVTTGNGHEIRLLNTGNPNLATDGILAGDETGRFVLEVNGKIVNDPQNAGGRVGRLGILDSVRLTNPKNSFGGKGSYIDIGDASRGTNGFLYLSSDKVLGDPSNKVVVERGGLVGEGSFASARPLEYLTSASIDVMPAKAVVSWNGSVSGGPGPLVKKGPGELVLTADNGQRSNRIEAGTLTIAKDANLGRSGGPISLGNNAVLQVDGTFASPRALRIASDGSGIVKVLSERTWTLDGRVSGGQLVKQGLGELVLTKNNGQSSTAINQGSLAVSGDEQLGIPSAPLLFTGVTSGKPTLHVTGNLTTNRPIKLTEFTDSAIAVNKDKTLTVMNGITSERSASLDKKGPGRLTLATGSSSNVSGFMHVRDGTLKVDGNLVVQEGLRGEPGSNLFGKGKITTGLFDTKGKVGGGADPGTLTIEGTVQMDVGSSFEFDINSAVGAPGSPLGWGLLDVVGPMELTGSHLIDLVTFGLDGQRGPMAAGLFDPLQSYEWLFATASGGVSGFDPGLFTFDLSSFQNATAPGYGFSVVENGNDLFIDYGANVSAVPAPLIGRGVPVLLAVSILFGAKLLKRSRKRPTFETLSCTRRHDTTKNF